MSKPKIDFEFRKLDSTERPDINIPEVSAEDIEKDRGGYVIVSLAKDWCLKNNDSFADEGNKSFPHKGLECVECKEATVISNRMYEIVKKNSSLKVICMPCVPALVKKENENA